MTFGSRVAFADLGGRQTAWTGDRREFLGRNGTLDNPAALAGDRFSQRGSAPASIPAARCKPRSSSRRAARRKSSSSSARRPNEVDAQSLLAHYRVTDLERDFLARVAHWDEVLDAIQVKTPERCMDVMLNRWLLYQTLACRIWARSAFYQAVIGRCVERRGRLARGP